MTQSLEEFKKSQRRDQTKEEREIREQLKEKWHHLRSEQKLYCKGYEPQRKFLKRGKYYCPNCGSILLKFFLCEDCGKEYILTCPSCGYQFADIDLPW